MTIGKKISLACAALVALTVALGTVAIVNIGRISASVQLIGSDSLPGVFSISRMESLAKEQNEVMLSHVLSDTPEQMSRLEAAYTEVEAGFRAESKI